MKHVSVTDLPILLADDNAVLIDVRNPEAYQSGHISGALNYQLADLENFNDDKDRTYVVICTLGQRSLTASQLLEDQGYRVVNVIEGMSAWTGDVVGEAE